MNDGDFELITLRNGSRAVRHTGHGEVMHPAVGPWAEANALYVEQSHLSERLTLPGSAPLRLYDVGLGAAANAAAALTCAVRLDAQPRRRLELVSFEKDLAPLRLALADPDGFPFLVPWAGAARCLIETGQWEGKNISWTLFHGELLDCLSHAPGNAELVFFDPFSPDTNPTLWTRAAFAALRAQSSEDCLLLTYSAATPVRVGLLLAGFFVGLGAPIGSKSQTTVASTRLESLEKPLDFSFLERWRRSSARAPLGETLSPEMESQIANHSQFLR